MKAQCLLAGALSLAACAAHAADTYPSRAVTMIVGAAPGGGSDQLARPLALELAKELKQPVVVENRGGGGGIIASKALAAAPADGYTIALITDAHVVSAAVQRNKPYDPVKDFSAVGIVGTAPLVMVTSAPSGIKTFEQFLNKARENPGGLTYGSSGIGANLHLATARLANAADVEMLHIPFKSGGEAFQELLAGRLDMTMAAPGNAIPFREDARVNLIGVTSAEPVAELPGVPTIKSTGMDYQYATSIALIAPANVPQPVIARLNEALNNALKAPELTKVFATQLVTGTPGAPEALTQKLTNDLAQVDAAIKNGDLKLLD